MISGTAERILDQAQALMVVRGYNAFSYADIAEVVKVSKATIHFHFATKSVLAEEVVRRYRHGAIAKLRQLSVQESNAPARLVAYARYWENCIRTTAPLCMCALLAAEIVTLPDGVKAEVQAFFREGEGWLASTLDDGVRQGTLSLPGGAALEAKALLAVVYGAMLAARVFGDATAFGAVVGAAIERLKVAVPAHADQKARMPAGA